MYSAQIEATGGQPAYTFAITAGALPAGLSMNGAGLVTGATTAVPGTYHFTVRVTDSANPAQSVTKQLSITVVKGTSVLHTAPVVLAVDSAGNVTINIAVFEADLKGGNPLIPIAGAPIVFKSSGVTVCTANTDAQGHVKCQPNNLNALLLPLLAGKISASYAGSALWTPATSSAGLVGQ
jgi:hypothetical protein